MIIELTRHSIILITPASRLVLHVYSTACYVTMKKYPTKVPKVTTLSAQAQQMMIHALHRHGYLFRR